MSLLAAGTEDVRIKRVADVFPSQQEELAYPSFLPDGVQDQVQSALDLVEALNDPSRTDTLIALYEQERSDLLNVLDIIVELDKAKKGIQKRVKLIDKSLQDLRPVLPSLEEVDATTVKDLKKVTETKKARRSSKRKKAETETQSFPEVLKDVTDISDFD